MHIVIGCDNAAVSLKNTIIALLKTKNVEIEDVGCFTSDDPTYYPLVAKRACEKIIESGYTKRGILICGTGLGMCMTANKFKGIRAAVCHDIFSTERSILSNNGNVLCMGERVIGPGLAVDVMNAFLDAAFEGGRHQRRVDLITELEKR